MKQVFLFISAAIFYASSPYSWSQGVDFEAPPPAEGLPVPQLQEGPFVYDTGEGNRIKVVVVARGLNHPYSVAFLPGGTILVSEKNTGQLRIIRDDILDPRPVGGIPEVVVNNFSGLLDIELHPAFEDNQLIYFSYNKVLPNNNTAVAVAHGRWDGQDLNAVEDVYVSSAGTIAGSRIVFGADGHLYISIFGAFGAVAQDPTTVQGKVLRVTENGEIPDDNPFVGMEGYQPEIYSLGHRSVSGLALHKQTGKVWELEMGPNGGDEVNILEPGENYGWPSVSTGRDYAGPYQSESFNNVDGMVDPAIYWMPSISVSGMTFYNGDKFPRWQGNLFVGGMKTGEIGGTGRLERFLLNENMEELRRESLFVNLRQRIRDVKESPDGYIYVVTDEIDGAVLRIEPE